MARGLGRDFFSILDDNIFEEKKDSVTTLKISDIEPRADQPRKTFDNEGLQTLADSIATHGVLQPIIVRENPNFAGSYEIIAGERRWRASKMAGLSEIPVVLVDGNDLKVAQIAIIENVQRDNLNAYEEAQAYSSLMNEFSLTQEEVAAKVNKSRSAIANTMRLLDLPDEVLELLKAGDISAGHGRALLGLKDKEIIVDTAHKILIRSLSVRDTETLVKKLNKIYEASLKGEEENEVDDDLIVDYIKDLERKAMSLTGKQIKIQNKGKCRLVQIEYVDNEDLEDILVKLCGKKITEE